MSNVSKADEPLIKSELIKSQSKDPDSAASQADSISSGLFSSISLIAGTTIGAGILALPAATLPAGLIPSSLVMIATWLYMVISGLLFAEANVYTRQQLGRADVGFLATIQYLSGKWGAISASILYIFIHYAMLVAYTARGGDILATAIQPAQAALHLSQPIPLWSGHLLFSVLFGGLLFWCSEQFIGRFNSLLLILVIVAFAGLLTLTIPQVQPNQLLTQHWEVASTAIPVMFTAFVYQNVVPIVITQQNNNKVKAQQSIVLGALIPLILFLLWNGVILGSIDFTTIQQTSDLAANPVIDPIEILRLGKAHPQLSLAVSIFSEFAVATSFIGFAYGLLSVFKDLFASPNPTAPSSPTSSPQKRPFIYGLIVLPPLGLSLLSPTIFFDAIDTSGALGTSLLFGIIPAVMVWKLRYRESNNISETWIPGGKVALIIMGGIAIAVIIQYLLDLL